MIFSFDRCIFETAMDKAQPDPLSLQRNVILGLLLALAAAAWAVLVWQHADVTMDMTASITLGPRVPLFLVIWVAMMVAMMFPTAVPMILTFHRVQAGNRKPGDAFATTWVFVAAYLLVWACAGMLPMLGCSPPKPLRRGSRYRRPRWPKSAVQSSPWRVSTNSPR